ncbi:TPA: hypothetical protein KSS35_003705 [Clostridioides difficile]|jgi:predicted transcriptional regulator|uniref:hypothetical protein n=1 Tax=Bacillati TaxID=1783272 RepID=UPI0008A8C650|nr:MULTISPECIES: hypothetical protein [Terrabacteria group]MDU6064586.1 hypothetical protein [Anaerococcus sp.]MDU6720294.1 hypothetical protein [Veillonella sp.]HBH4199373.1 hypothetical protein [Clostridioides difficile]MBF2137992.1 hypothetical protein [Staphylococcus epidermidis]MBF2165527.1 hypothetical protein [Staphylococcus epidermidis]
MLTIKQLADKLGVSKPTITRNKPENMEFTVIDGVNYIDDTLEQQITEKVLQNKTRYSNDTSTETHESTLVQQLLQQNAFLRTQIEEKDALLKTQAKLLDQQQQLNLITGQRLNKLESGSEESTEVEKESATEKKGIFKRWFGQNK